MVVDDFLNGLPCLYDSKDLPPGGTYQLIWQGWPDIGTTAFLNEVYIEVKSKSAKKGFLLADELPKLFYSRKSMARFEIALEGKLVYNKPVKQAVNSSGSFKLVTDSVQVKSLSDLRVRIVWEPEPIRYNVKVLGLLFVRATIILSRKER